MPSTIPWVKSRITLIKKTTNERVSAVRLPTRGGCLIKIGAFLESNGAGGDAGDYGWTLSLNLEVNMKKCTLCDNKRYSSHWLCKYCISCRDKMWKAQQKRWKTDNKEHLANYRAVKMHDWKKNRNIKIREHAKTISDAYVRWTLAQRSPLKGSEFPEGLVRLKRLDIQLKREKESQNGKEASKNK